MVVNGNLKFHTLGAGQLENAIIERLTAAPTGAAGRIYYNTGAVTPTDIGYWFHDGSTWVKFATGGNAAALQTKVDNIETAVGLNSDGTFDAAAYTDATYITTPTTVANAIMQLDAAIDANNTLAELDDVTLGALTTGDFLRYSGTAWTNQTATLGDLSNVANGVDTATNDDILAYDGSAWTVVTVDTMLEAQYLPTTGDILKYTGTSFEALAIGSEAGVQAYDLGLANLATGGTGLVAMDGDTVAFRTLTAPAAGITVTNGDGVLGNPTLALANDLAALEGLSTTGYIVRTGDGTATTRSIAGTTDRISVLDGDGVASDTSIDLATVTQASSGNFVKITLDGYGRVTGNTPVVAGDITALVDSTYVNVTGDTMSGTLNMGTNTITGVATPTADTDAANKAYVDALTAGLSWKQAVRVATTADLDLAAPGASIDGVALTAGDRVLVKDNTPASENGIYIWNGAASAMTRASDMNAPSEFDGAAVFVQEGTQAGSGWTETATVTTVDTSDVTFSQFTGGALYTWGTGLTQSGNTINVNLGAGIVELPSDEVGIDLYDAANGALVLTTTGSNRTTDTAAALYLMLDAAGGLAQTSAGLKINAASVTNAMLVNSGFTLNGDTGTDPIALGDTLQVKGVSTQGTSVAVTESPAGTSTFTVTVADATSTQKGVATFNTADFLVTAGDVTIKTAGVGNAQLENSTITMSDGTNTDAVALGESLLFTQGEGIDITVGANEITIAAELATSSNPGVASFSDTTHFTVTAGDVTFNASSINLGDLGNVGTASPTDNGVLVGNGTTWETQQIYFLYDGASATSHTVTHALGVRYCNVTVIDSATNEVIIPQSIVFDSTTALTVTFNTAVACKVVVMGIA